MPEWEFSYFQKRNPGRVFDIPEAINKNFCLGTFLNIGPSGTILKKEAFEKWVILTLDYEVPSDMYFNLKMGSFYPIVLLRKVFFFYRVHDGQELKNKYSYVCFNYKYLYDAFNITGFPLSETQKNYFLKKRQKGHLSNNFSII